ncbi:rCG63557 [Rattus norvegicus]|uniref:RCG63557 n=1 Tax=Rattus norvegicus TaxID=10116 RepID=A6JBW7_RAT|nr:rCG63557 [Rattus norvegicus]
MVKLNWKSIWPAACSNE